MADSVTEHTTIDATRDACLDVLLDFERYPEWANEVTSATVLSEDGDGWADQVEFHLHAGAIKDHYVLEYDWDIAKDGTGSVSWHLVRATLLKGLDGTYALSHTATGGTSVTYDLEVELTMPMIGLLKRKAEKHIINLALTELKKRAEG